jgi:DNA-binding transcriptional LysR family regulator
MDTIDNMRTFIAVVRSGNFSAAARALDTVPSVIAKRIGQLEHRLKVPLFHRSTRSLELTEAGTHYHARFKLLLADIDSVFREDMGKAPGLQERLRIKCPTTLTVSHFGNMLTDFQSRNPGVRMEIMLMDRSVNPLEEGFDISIGALPASFANVVDIPLCCAGWRSHLRAIWSGLVSPIIRAISCGTPVSATCRRAPTGVSKERRAAFMSMCPARSASMTATSSSALWRRISASPLWRGIWCATGSSQVALSRFCRIIPCPICG